MRLTIPVLTLLATLHAQAADRWETLATGRPGDSIQRIEIDADRIDYDGAYVKLWGRWIYDRPQSGLTEKTFLVTKSLLYIDCAARSTALRKSVHYVDITENIIAGQFEAPDLTFSPAVPESNGDALVDAGCRIRPAEAAAILKGTAAPPRTH